MLNILKSLCYSQNVLVFIVGEIECFPNVSARGAINWFVLLSGPSLLVFSKYQNSHGRRVRGTEK